MNKAKTRVCDFANPKLAGIAQFQFAPHKRFAGLTVKGLSSTNPASIGDSSEILRNYFLMSIPKPSLEVSI